MVSCLNHMTNSISAISMETGLLYHGSSCNGLWPHGTYSDGMITVSAKSFTGNIIKVIFKLLCHFLSQSHCQRDFLISLLLNNGSFHAILNVTYGKGHMCRSFILAASSRSRGAVWDNFPPLRWVFPLRCAFAQSDQTISAVKSHSRALVTFQVLYRIYIA